MFYGFIDGQYSYSAQHIAYLKKQLDEDMDVFGGAFAIIYNGKKSVQCRTWDSKWKMFKSEHACRPDIWEREE